MKRVGVPVEEDDLEGLFSGVVFQRSDGSRVALIRPGLDWSEQEAALNLMAYWARRGMTGVIGRSCSQAKTA